MQSTSDIYLYIYIYIYVYLQNIHKYEESETNTSHGFVAHNQSCHFVRSLWPFFFLISHMRNYFPSIGINTRYVDKRWWRTLQCDNDWERKSTIREYFMLSTTTSPAQYMHIY